MARLRPSLTWLSEEAPCLARGRIQRELIEVQTARLRAMALPEEGPSDAEPNRSANHRAKTEILRA